MPIAVRRRGRVSRTEQQTHSNASIRRVVACCSIRAVGVKAALQRQELILFTLRHQSIYALAWSEMAAFSKEMLTEHLRADCTAHYALHDDRPSMHCLLHFPIPYNLCTPLQLRQ